MPQYVRQHAQLTTDSYNSAVFFIGANNEYDIYAFQKGYDDTSLNFLPEDKDKNYEYFEGSSWIGMYDNSFVSYGTFALIMDEYRSSINLDTATGKPEKWPDVSQTVADTWSRGTVSWDKPETVVKRLGTRDFIQDILATGANSREWIKMITFTSGAEMNTTKSDIPAFAHVSGVLARKVDTDSKIQLSLTFLIVVIVCNSVKLLTMLWVVFMERKDYVVTLGDGASTFLERPDPATERMCILSKSEITQEVAEAHLHGRHRDQLATIMAQSKKEWVKRHSTYSNALNRDREIGSYFM